MTPNTKDDPSFSSHRFIWQTPDGIANIHIAEAEPIFIQINIGKAGTSVASWAYALAELVNALLHYVPLDRVIDILSGISSQQTTMNKEIECRSTAEAVSFALQEYQRIKKKEEKKR